MPQIIPIKDLRDTNKLSEMCNSTNEPIFVTKNGYGDMVIMSMKTFEEKFAKIEIYEKIIAGLNDNKLIDGKEALNSLKEKYGL